MPRRRKRNYNPRPLRINEENRLQDYPDGPYIYQSHASTRQWDSPALADRMGAKPLDDASTSFTPTIIIC